MEGLEKCFGGSRAGGELSLGESSDAHRQLEGRLSTGKLAHGVDVIANRTIKPETRRRSPL